VQCLARSPCYRFSFILQTYFTYFEQLTIHSSRTPRKTAPVTLPPHKFYMHHVIIGCKKLENTIWGWNSTYKWMQYVSPKPQGYTTLQTTIHKKYGIVVLSNGLYKVHTKCYEILSQYSEVEREDRRQRCCLLRLYFLLTSKHTQTWYFCPFCEFIRWVSLVKKPEGLHDLHVDGRIILKRIFENAEFWLWSGFVWHKIGSSGGFM
jgi:hypothetical protein